MFACSEVSERWACGGLFMALPQLPSTGQRMQLGRYCLICWKKIFVQSVMCRKSVSDVVQAVSVLPQPYLQSIIASLSCYKASLPNNFVNASLSHISSYACSGDGPPETEHLEPHLQASSQAGVWGQKIKQEVGAKKQRHADFGGGREGPHLMLATVAEKTGC